MSLRSAPEGSDQQQTQYSKLGAALVGAALALGACDKTGMSKADVDALIATERTNASNAIAKLSADVAEEGKKRVALEQKITELEKKQGTTTTPATVATMTCEQVRACMTAPTSTSTVAGTATIRIPGVKATASASADSEKDRWVASMKAASKQDSPITPDATPAGSASTKTPDKK